MSALPAVLQPQIRAAPLAVLSVRFPTLKTLLHAGVRITQLSSCTYKNARIFRHNPWVWMPAQMLLHVFISIISQGLDASSKAAPLLLHQIHRVWMPAPMLLLIVSIKFTPLLHAP